MVQEVAPERLIYINQIASDKKEREEHINKNPDAIFADKTFKLKAPQTACNSAALMYIWKSFEELL